MIEHKEKLFKQGIGIFAVHFAQRDQRAYIQGMVHENGYVAAAKKFYEHSAYLNKEDRDNLYNHNIVPAWMTKVILEVEQQLFGQTFWDKQ